MDQHGQQNELKISELCIRLFEWLFLTQPISSERVFVGQKKGKKEEKKECDRTIPTAVSYPYNRVLSVQPCLIPTAGAACQLFRNIAVSFCILSFGSFVSRIYDKSSDILISVIRTTM